MIEPATFEDRGAFDAAVLAALQDRGIDVLVSAGWMRLLGRAVLDAYEERWLNVHPALLPSFPGMHGVADALAYGVKVTGVTVHLVDEGTDTGPIVLQEAVGIRDDDDWDTLEERIHAAEHRVLPAAVRAMLEGRVSVEGRRVRNPGGAVSEIREVRRALLAVYDKSGVVELARGLRELDVELVSSGGTASALREADLDVTEVANVTGFPELLDGRVKTLHPRDPCGHPGGPSQPSHVEQLAEHGIAPFDLVVVNLYPFRETVASGAEPDDVIEKIDIGGPAMVRAAAKNFESVGVIVNPDRYEPVLDEIRLEGGLTPIHALRARDRGVRPHRLVRRRGGRLVRRGAERSR